jgi:hypothetical protein
MHPTQIFLHNPEALRAEFRIDDGRLILWWSPKAGESLDCADRNFSCRDNPLCVFEELSIGGFKLDQFIGCDYDPYHCVLRFQTGTLHLAIAVDEPVVYLWSDRDFNANFKSGRYDERLAGEARLFSVMHPEPAYRFEFAAALGAGGGRLVYSAVQAPWNSHYVQACVAAGQMLVIGTGLDGGKIRQTVGAMAQQTPAALLASVDAALAPIEALGRVEAPSEPELEALRRLSVRALHSMIDRSGAFRASIKAIYYLIWVRDSGFSFGYQAAAGWPHRLAEVCRFLLANPTEAQGEGVPPGRFFGQLINRTYGKYEEDGTFYAVWLVFTHWTQTGSRELLDEGALTILAEALDWVERRTFDAERGLFGNYFGDETPAFGSRDQGFDYAIGKPGGTEHMAYEGQPVVRSYDIYFNLLQHSAYCMMAALSGNPEYTRKADQLWTRLEALLQPGADGLPGFGELLLADGTRVKKGPWSPSYCGSIYPWALALPCFAPAAGLDAIRIRLLEGIFQAPEMHFINGINAAIAAVDPWLCPEEAQLVAMHREIAAQSMRSGKYLPMGGAMPEKYNAPEGNLYHDIRPQGFAMGSWLAAFAGLGVRRLPYGLALRPSACVRRVADYPWRGRTLDLRIETAERNCQLEIDGVPVPGTLQLPSDLLESAAGEVRVELQPAAEAPAVLLLRSTVELLSVRDEEMERIFTVRAFGLSELAFSVRPGFVGLTDESGAETPHHWTEEPGIAFLRFTQQGLVTVRVKI